jgi:hypothetical protein
LILPVRAVAQAPPATDIYLATVVTRGGELRFGDPINVTDRTGYDNQPLFMPGGDAVLYTSIRDGQADTYRYDMATGTATRVTRTPESEYSPTVMPGGRAFSVVRVEMDSTQRLWRFALDGTEPRLVVSDVKPVGYHAWADDHTVALFVLGDPPTLQLVDTETGEVVVAASNIGRSLHKVPGRNSVSFLQRVSEDEAWISAIDVATRNVRRLIQPLEGNEFYAWTPDGAIVMGQGSKLWMWREGEDESWREVADFGAAGLRDISRIAVSPRGDYVAVVGARP